VVTKGAGDALRKRVGIRVRISAGKVVRMEGQARCCRRYGGSAGKLGFVGFTRRQWMRLLVTPVVVGTKETTQPRAGHQRRICVPTSPYVHTPPCGATAL